MEEHDQRIECLIAPFTLVSSTAIYSLWVVSILTVGNGTTI